MDLNEHQTFEREWWGNCVNTFGEEAKQITYAWSMGLENVPDARTGQWPQYDLGGKSVIDLGGGPVSMLLKCINGIGLTVVDPCLYPMWISTRYAAAGITYFQVPAEGFTAGRVFDECWIYNVLQHVEDPLEVMATAHRHAKTLRIFEWVNTPPTLGHPHTLTKVNLDAWIGNSADGTVSFVNQNSAVGDAYYGVFTL